MSQDTKACITGIGNTLVNLIINESDQFLEKLGKQKGGMDLVEDQESNDILAQTQTKPIIATGGSTCNTIVGAGKLGINAYFIGNRGDDSFGEAFEKQLIDSNVGPILSTGQLSTGRVLSIVTPDAQRSMFTYLGASTELDPESIKPEIFKNADIIMVEGYLLFNDGLIMPALKAAKETKALIALDLSSFEVVNATKTILKTIIKEYVDILIANEEEAKAYTGFDDELKAVEALSKNVSYAVLKVGAEGSYISHKEKVIHIEPVRGNPPIDTTGAGDLWAAGFLYGLANGLSLEKSGQIASACGYEVCQVMGAQLSDEAWDKIKAII